MQTPFNDNNAIIHYTDDSAQGGMSDGNILEIERKYRRPTLFSRYLVYTVQKVVLLFTQTCTNPNSECAVYSRNKLDDATPDCVLDGRVLHASYSDFSRLPTFSVLLKPQNPQTLLGSLYFVLLFFYSCLVSSPKAVAGTFGVLI